MTASEVAQKSPYKIELTAGQEYWWCACGRSKNQPLCGFTAFRPVQYKATETS
jgi:CDGSH-type Zn-finger protein